MIIPIGIDCSIASSLLKYNLRSYSFPFDWVVTFNGVADIIKNDFLNYIPDNNEILNIKCDTLFLHNTFPNDNEKILRKITRFKNLLETTNDKIIFIRKGHVFNHHKAHNNKYDIIKSDIKDAEDLDIILQEKYPNLQYEIIVILCCTRCFNPNEKNYITNSKNIKIYNISTFDENDIILYDNLFFELFNIIKN